MARIYRRYSFPAVTSSDIATVYAQIKADLQADSGFITHAVAGLPVDEDILFFWPVQHGSAPDYTNDDVPIWGLRHANIGDSNDTIDLLTYRGDVSLFDGSESYNTYPMLDLSTYWNPQLGGNVTGICEFSYAIASDVPVFVATHSKNGWDWGPGSLIQICNHMCAAIFRRVAADWGNGLATRYGLLSFHGTSGTSMFSAGVRSSEDGGEYIAWVYPEAWSPLQQQASLSVGGVQSSIARTAIAPIFPQLLGTPNLPVVVFGEVQGIYIMAGRPSVFGEVVAPGLMAFGPTVETEIGTTIVFPLCPLAT